LGLKSCKSDFADALDFELEASLGTFAKKKDSLEDMLRTHPFSEDRKAAFIKEFTIDTADYVDETYLKFKGFAQKEVIVNAIMDRSIDRALFYLLQAYEKDSTDLFNRKLIPFCFAYLGYEKIKRRAGNLVNTQSPYSDENYNRVIHFLRKLSPEQCFEITRLWNSRVEPDLEKYLSNSNEAILALAERDDETFQLRKERETDPCYYYLQTILEDLSNN
jgi:hypothetical protein